LIFNEFDETGRIEKKRDRKRIMTRKRTREEIRER
jgi:hypothetical protein